ncbi:MAG: MBL fold metallo-hydrolase [Bryobacteraceae bacterium]|nr:MBL fold metallo-hydrolase [Bryobacteraceae bacterium]
MVRLFLLLLTTLSLHAAKTLDIYFVDVEGGQATLMVTPSGESMLVDTGWPGFDGRDAKRIAAAAEKAGVKKIDWLVITHFHTDHVGGIRQLADRLPIVNIIDHGQTVESSKNAQDLTAMFTEVASKARRRTVKPGDTIAVKGLKVEVLAAHGEAATRKGQPNPLCGAAQRKADDPSDNARSVGTLITFGRFRFLDLGDLTWNKELELVCPENRIGKVDLYLTTHHGMDASGPKELVHAIAPRVAIMNNGEKKGGAPPAWQVIKSSPGLQDLWQVHFSAAGGAANNVDEKMIANPAGQDPGHYLMVQAQSNGKFSVTNSRNGFTKSY